MSRFSGFEKVVREGELLAMYTWFQLGGPAEYFAEPHDAEQLMALLARCRQEDLPARLLGGGSNILVRDPGVRGVVIRLSEPAFCEIAVDGCTIVAGGGARLGQVVTTAVREGLTGLESLVAIPGTVGGALHGNAGTHSADIGQWIAQATVVTYGGDVITRNRDELVFGYRESSLDDLVILSAKLQLEEDDPRELAKRLQKQWIVRKASQPMGHQSAGCVFKNPGGVSAGELIERSGLKGTRIGGAVVSERHGNYIVAEHDCTSTDVLRLIDLVRDQVEDRLGVELELELEIWQHMAATKKTQPGSGSALGAWVGPGIRLARGPVGATVLLAAVLVGGWYVVWHLLGESLLRSERYVLRQENLEVTPPPEWIHTDVRGEVFRSVAFEGPLTIMDDHLTQRIADGFALHPWVAKVRRVTKLHPARVKVELDYRRPVCMVEVPGGLLPVDAESAWLRSEDFSPVEASQYPRLSGLDSMPVGSVGTKWGDGRVVGGAEIAALLLGVWKELQLARIVPSARPQSGLHYSFDLYTRGGTRIIWGLAPGAGVTGDVPAAERIERLRKYLAAHGTFDGPHQLDLRSVRGVEILPPMR